MAYEDNSVYAKYLAQKINSEEGCSECNESSSSSKCSCCAPGLVAVYNSDGVQLACLTPADAEAYNTNNKSCKEGFVALYKNGSPDLFLGCVPSDEFVALYKAVNPVTP